MKSKFKDIVLSTMQFLISEYGYVYESEDDWTHKFIGPHLNVEIYYGKWELDVVLYRRVYTSVLRPNKIGSFYLEQLLQCIESNELSELHALAMSHTEKSRSEAPKYDELEKTLQFYARKLKEHFSMVLKDDLKFLEQLAVKYNT